MENVLKKTLLCLCLITALVGCENKALPSYATPTTQAIPAQVAPAPVQAAPHSDNSALTGALIGGALGYMAGRSNSTPTPSYQPPVVNRTVVVNRYITQAPKPAYVAPTPVTAYKSVPVSVAKTIPSAPAPVKVETAKKISLNKPSSSSSSFGGFNRRTK